MEKTIIIYWSGTGNTEVMAQKIYDGYKEKNEMIKIVSVFDIKAEEALTYDKLILGSPAMGLEQLEALEFEPFFEEIEPHITNKKIALFGSFGWGDGEWMDKWEERVKKAGAILFDKGLRVFSTPSTEEEERCFILGQKLVDF